MTVLADQLIADWREILAQLAAWAADPRAAGAARRSISIIDSMTMHARFMDVAVAPLIDPHAAAEAAGGRQVIQQHRPVMSLLYSLREAMDHGLSWAILPGILVDVIFPHLVLHDHLLLSALHQALPAACGDELGQVFILLKAEVAPAAEVACADRFGDAGARAALRAPRGRRPGHERSPQGGVAGPWRRHPQAGRRARRAADCAPAHVRARRCVANPRQRRRPGSPP